MHTSMHSLYKKTLGEQDDNVVKVFQVLLKSTFIPKAGAPSSPPNDITKATTVEKPEKNERVGTGATKSGKPKVPSGWTKRDSHERFVALNGKCLSCGHTGHVAKACTANRSCDYSSVCSKLTTWKHNTSCCEYVPPAGWVKPT
jgi:hypothetical protein